MSLFNWKKNLAVSEKEPEYKVRYLGNVQTAMMRGDGCVDKPVNIIWNNYTKSANPGLEMKLSITSSGLKANTKEQGVTEYRAHRISYCIAHPKFPRLFVWVYRHEGKKMKLELRCHAVLCKTEAKAKAMALQLHEKLRFALSEFMREKTRKQNSRLILQRTNSLPQSGNFMPKRTQFLTTGQNFKPPISKSNTAPRLGAISEDFEFEHEECGLGDLSEVGEEGHDDLEDESETVKALTLCEHGHPHVDGLTQRVIDIEIGNDIDELEHDESVQFCISNGDSDDESSESGFHEADQDSKEGLQVADDTSLGEEEVCDLPTGLMVGEPTEVTCL